MIRREFMVLLGGAAAWPLAARGQQPAMPLIGYISARSPEDTAHLLSAFRKGLAENGYVESQNVTIEFQWALGQHERLRPLAVELAGKPVALLVSTAANQRRSRPRLRPQPFRSSLSSGATPLRLVSLLASAGQVETSPG